MQASKEMEEVLKRIHMPSVFYFPKKLFPNLSPETKKVLEEYRFFEDLGILKANGDEGLLKRAANTLEIFKKDDILEAYVFRLLETTVLIFTVAKMEGKKLFKNFSPYKSIVNKIEQAMENDIDKENIHFLSKINRVVKLKTVN